MNIYAINIKAPKYIKETLLKLKAAIKQNTLVVGDFNTSLPPMDRSVRKKPNREIRE